MIRNRLLWLAVLLLAAPSAASAQNIYKCTQDGRVTYTDRPCPGRSGELLHKADDADVIDQYLRLGQNAEAKQYADARNLDALYQARMEAHENQLAEAARRRAEDASAAQQREADGQQQALADAAAETERLRGENDALREKNVQYQDELSAPLDSPLPAYWPVSPPYWDRPPHRPRPDEPFFHPCTQLAGGRVQC